MNSNAYVYNLIYTTNKEIVSTDTETSNNQLLQYVYYLLIICLM